MRHIKHLLASKFLFILALLYTIFITTGSLINTSSLPNLKGAISDKLIHSVSYFFLMLFWALYFLFKHQSEKVKTLLLVTACLVFVYGIIIEVLQEVLSESRTADVLDVAANTAGIIVAVLGLTIFQKKILKLKSKN